MITKEKGFEYWERYVGSQTPIEFMELAFAEAQKQGEDTCIYWALEDYLENLGVVSGPGTKANAPKDLMDCLLSYMFSVLGVYTLQSWKVYGHKGDQ